MHKQNNTNTVNTSTHITKTITHTHTHPGETGNSTMTVRTGSIQANNRIQDFRNTNHGC